MFQRSDPPERDFESRRQEGGTRCPQGVELGPLPSAWGQATAGFSCVPAFLISASSIVSTPWSLPCRAAASFQATADFKNDEFTVSVAAEREEGCHPVVF